MHRETRIDRFEILSDGHIQLRFHKAIVDDDGSIVGQPEYHRTVISPDTDPAFQIGQVRDHLEAMKFPLAGEEDLLAKLKALAEVFHTPEVVAAYKERTKPLPEAE